MNDQVIGHINKIQEIFLRHRLPDKIDLPQIVVIGSQSCGKSSLLEMLIGEEFLPKGEGIVTRCPILIQMTRDKTLTRNRVRFGHQKDKVFEDFRAARDEIIAQTERLAGKNKGVSSEPIVAKVEGPQVLPLSFVDLPGLTRIPVNGQPENIETQILELNHKFVDDPNTIIVAISSANNDIANSESLKLAMRVDPDGLRTVGVVSKIDLHEGTGKSLENLFNRKTINLKLGFIAVTTKRMTPEAERQFLDAYPALTPQTYGAELLRTRMCELLRSRITASIPLLRNSLHGVLKVT